MGSTSGGDGQAEGEPDGPALAPLGEGFPPPPTKWGLPIYGSLFAEGGLTRRCHKCVAEGWILGHFVGRARFFAEVLRRGGNWHSADSSN